MPSRMLVVWAALTFSVAALAQSTGQEINGIVKDASGAVVSGARITARQTETGLVRDASTNGSGYFVVANIPIGAYTLEVESPGFQKSVRTGIRLNIEDKVTLEIGMTLGSVSDTITVTADAVQVDNTSGEVSRLVDGQQAAGLQFNGRNYTQLLSLIPGVSTNNQSDFDLATGYGAAVTNQSVNGIRSGTLSVYVDGSDNLATGGGGHSFVNINPDAIAEFKVLTSNYSAEYGQSAGAVMNMAMKSGTMSLHGSAYEYLRNQAFDARSFGAISNKKLTYNNFGWNLGGPIYGPGRLAALKNKLFFFGGMDLKRLRRGNPTLWTVPLPVYRTGNFSGLAASSWPKDPLNGSTVFPGGIIPASRISPNAARLLANYPLPNYTGSGGNFSYSWVFPMNVTQYMFKFDYNLNEKHQFSFFRVHDQYFDEENLAQLVTYNRTIPGTNESAKWTYVISSTAVNTLQFSLPGHHIYQGQFAPNPWFINDYSRQGQGINYPMLYNSNSSIPSIGISGYTGLTVSPVNWNNSDRIIFLKDDYSKVIGQHTFKAGVFYQRNRKNQDNQPTVNGSFSFATGHALSSGNALADAVLGNFSSYTEANGGREGWFRFTQVEWYAGDQWRIGQRLSLTYGLRMDYMPQQYSPLQNTVVFSPAFYNPAQAPTVNPSDGSLVTGTGNPTNGLAVGGSSYPAALQARFPGLSASVFQSLFRGLPVQISPNFLVPSPRVGFSYDITGRQKTVLRGGYGMFYERVQGNFIFSEINNPPFVRQVTIYTANIENPSGGTTRSFPSTVTSFDPGVKLPTVQNYSLGVQHRLAKDTMLDVAFVGSNSWHLYRNVNLNQLPVGTLVQNPGINTNALRPYPGYADINQLITGSNGHYDSLQVQGRKQFTGGGLINLSYTWSKSITDASGYNETAMDSYNFKRDRGLSSFDRRQIMMLSLVYPLPFWKEQNIWYRKAFGGWELSGIGSLQSGLPVNILVSGDIAGTGVGNQRPNVVGDWQSSGGTVQQWFNTAAFANPAKGTFGSLGRNVVIGPGVNNWDLAMHKTFAFTERLRTQFKFQMYNAPNHLSYWGVGNTVGSSNFGQVTSAKDARTLQFALKMTF